MPVVGIVTDYQRSAAALSAVLLANWYRHFGFRVRLLSACKICRGLDEYWDPRVIVASDRNLYDARVQCQTLWWCSNDSSTVKRYRKFKVSSDARHMLLPAALPDFDVLDLLDETPELFLSDMMACHPHRVRKAGAVTAYRRKVLVVVPRLPSAAANGLATLLQDMLLDQRVEVTLMTEHLGPRSFRSQCRMLSQWFYERFQLLHKTPYSLYPAMANMHDLVLVPLLNQDMNSHFAEKSHAAAMLGVGTPVYYVCLYTGVTEPVSFRLDCGLPPHIRSRDHGIEELPVVSHPEPGLQHVGTSHSGGKFATRSQKLIELLDGLSRTFLCDAAVGGTPWWFRVSMPECSLKEQQRVSHTIYQRNCSQLSRYFLEALG